MPKSPVDYSKMLKSELLALAKKAGLGGLGSLTKDRIIQRLRAAEKKIEGTLAGARRAASRPAAGAPRTTKTAAAKRPVAAGRAAAAAAAARALEGQSEQPETGEKPSDQTQAVRSKYEVGQAPAHELLDLDKGLPDLPEGYAANRIVLLPRDPRWLYAYWDITNEHKEQARRRGGRALALRLYDVTDVVFDGTNAHGMWEQDTHELARNWYLHVPAPGRRYCLEIGYRGAHGEWLPLARSNSVGTPSSRPSERVHDVFATIHYDEPLAAAPAPAAPEPPPARAGLHEVMFEADTGAAAPAPGASQGMSAGLGRERVPWSGAWSGVAGSVAAVPSSPPPAPETARSFWLRADAELIVYGATEPDAEVTCGGQKIPLRPDGTFYLRMHFPDGIRDFPIEATAVDREQHRRIRLSFQRHTE